MPGFSALFRRLPALLLTSGALLPLAAQAYSEDICYRYVKPGAKTGDVIPNAFNCWNLQCTDSVKPDNNPAQCVVSGLVRYLNATSLGGLQRRNSIHFDSVYLMARLRGLAHQDAFEAAMYSQSTDLGNYVHVDHNGKELTDSRTDNLHGIVRINNPSGGFAMHFVTWLRDKNDKAESRELRYNQSAGRAPEVSPFAASEATINQMRAWSFGLRKTVCQYGLSKNPGAVDGECFDAADKKTLFVSYPVFKVDASRDEGPGNVAAQPILLLNPDKCDDSKPETCVYDPGYAAKIHGSPKSLGIYLHVMGDRLSHSYCTDSAYIVEGSDPRQTNPEAAKADYSLWFNGECNQIAHTIRHYPETGHKTLPEQSVLTLDYTWRELGEWVKARNYFAHHPQQKPATPKRGFPKLNQPDKLVKLVGMALKKEKADERNAALCKIALHGYGITPWHDGSTDCRYPSTLAGK